VLGYLERSQSPDLSGSLYFDTSDLGDLQGSYPFTSFMSFVHLQIRYCLVGYTVPRLRTIESSGTQCGDCYSVPQRPLP
jgi:hypothetical protein